MWEKSKWDEKGKAKSLVSDWSVYLKITTLEPSSWNSFSSLLPINKFFDASYAK